jgi:Ca2+/Na+ antiporter
MSGWDLLTQGKWFDAALYPYTNIVGSEIFYTILLATILGVIYIKTRSLEMVSAALILGGIVLIPLIRPEVRVYFFVVIALGVAYALYVLFWRR